MKFVASDYGTYWNVVVAESRQRVFGRPTCDLLRDDVLEIVKILDMLEIVETMKILEMLENFENFGGFGNFEVRRS